MTEKAETVQHLRAKAQIMQACEEAGFRVSTEVTGDDWRADVLAERGGVRIAFEVQWSFLRLDETLRRQRRYARDGVRGCWFFRAPPPPFLRDDGTPSARQDLPLFHLLVNADLSFSVALNQRLHRLPAFVRLLLGGQVRFCETARARPAQDTEAQFYAIDCPHCGRRAFIYRLAETVEAACGVRFEGLTNDSALRFHPDVLAGLRAYRQTEAGRGLPLGEIKGRGGDSGLSFGCPYCDTRFTPQQVALALYGAHPTGGAFPVRLRLREPLTAPFAHWCYALQGDYCCG